MSVCHRNHALQTKIIQHFRKHTGMYKLAACVAVAALSPKVFNLSWTSSLAGAVALYLLTGGWRWVRLFYLTFGRDMVMAKTIISIELRVRKMLKEKKVVGDLLTHYAKLTPHKIAFQSLDTGKSLTYQQADELAIKIGNVFYEAGYRKGDVVALLLENTEEYVPLWVGLNKIGIICSLMNYNLRGESLKHCFLTSKCKAVIYSSDMDAFLKEISEDVKIEYYFNSLDKSEIRSHKNLKELIAAATDVSAPRPDDLLITDKMLYIYTSGTTGLPKAALIRGSRFTFMAFGCGLATKLTSEDKAYNTLPLYHSNGGICLGGMALFNGCTLFVRKKFSASRFFEDCHKSEATVFNYIGETCRYLLATPRGNFEKSHRVRYAMGNGLRASIWTQFTDRFNVPNICEFYGATEGNASLINPYNRVGSVGCNSILFPWVYPVKIVKVDNETGDMIRGPDGLAVLAKPGETGELCGKVRKDALNQFDGYVNREATQKKIAQNVFSKGDSVFMTGDILVQDEEGYYYFQDRCGDTFRWKGENVSTTEVENIMMKVLENEVCVYGVEVPGCDGKAGMAVITDPERQVNLQDLPSALSSSLPVYARPLFIRLSKEIPKTSTFKYKKVILRREGFNPKECLVGDGLYYYSGKEKAYLPITSEAYQDILDQKIRF